MKYFVLLWMTLSPFTVFSLHNSDDLEKKCPYGCGQRYRDERLIEIQKNVRKLLIKDSNIQGSSPEHKSYDVSCTIEVDDATHYKDYNPFKYDEWAEPSDVTYSRQSSKTNLNEIMLSLENYFDFLQLCEYLNQDIQNISSIMIYNSLQNIRLYKAGLTALQSEDEDTLKLYFNRLDQESQFYFFDSFYKPAKLFKEDISSERQSIKKRKKNKIRHLKTFAKHQNAINDLYLKIFDTCIEKHHSLYTYYLRGFHAYHEGDTIKALDDIRNYINSGGVLNHKTKLLQGKIESEVGLFDAAIVSLTQSLKLNPDSEESLIERAYCHFETGNFDTSIEDYLASGLAPDHSKNNSKSMISFSKGLVQGILQGGVEATTEFIPSTLSCIHGASNAMWAFAKEPVKTSKDFLDAVDDCITTLKENSTQETLKLIVPELRELIENWGTLKAQRKGELSGLVIGKYGVDIFAGIGITKGIKAYRELKRANSLLNFDAMTMSAKNRLWMKEEATRRAVTRKEVFKNATMHLEVSKQGKHIPGHINFDPKKNRSIFIHKNPIKLFKNHAGKGIKLNSRTPGTPGYQEIVNFGEIIGYDVNQKTGRKVATTWGKIHYSKKGFHIVPTTPR